MRTGDRVASGPGRLPWPQLRHASMTGRVLSIDGEVVIEGSPEPSGGRLEPHDDLPEMAFQAGIVGMGGGMFPTHVKLQPPAPVEYVIVNGCQSEPYVTCDERVLEEHGEEVRSGLELVQRALGARHGVVIVQERGYPEGYEGFLVRRVTGREIPLGKLPAHAGALVLNVQTARALHRAFHLGSPLVERVVTVDGGALARPGNYVVPLGTEVGHVLKMCGVDLTQAAVILQGGPMMGVRAGLDTPVKAGTIAVLALTHEEVSVLDEGHCIWCGACHDVCPRDIPVAAALEEASPDLRRCILCGACQYVCPAGIPLVPRILEARKGTERSR